jgi:hypothetical protein
MIKTKIIPIYNKIRKGLPHNVAQQITTGILLSSSTLLKNTNEMQICASPIQNFNMKLYIRYMEKSIYGLVQTRLYYK